MDKKVWRPEERRKSRWCLFSQRRRRQFMSLRSRLERRGFFSLHFLRFSYFVYAGECGKLPSQDPQILENAPLSSPSSFYKQDPCAAVSPFLILLLYTYRFSSNVYAPVRPHNIYIFSPWGTHTPRFPLAHFQKRRRKLEGGEGGFDFW